MTIRVSSWGRISFAATRECIHLWIKYYNHKRLHQGIEGLCPADRFFEIASKLRKTMEAGIQENLLEIALRGEPKAPFYIVSRMEGQSVILRAEKGKLKLSIDNGNENQELVYDLKQSETQTASLGLPDLLRPGESPSCPDGVDRALPPNQTVPATENPLITIDHWQRRAMEGMLQALEPRVNLAKGQVLSPRLQALLLNRQALTHNCIFAVLHPADIARTDDRSYGQSASHCRLRRK